MKERILGILAAAAVAVTACGGSGSGGGTSGAGSSGSGSTYSADLQRDAQTTVYTSKYKKNGAYTIAALTQGPGNGWGLTYDASLRYAAAHNSDIKNLIFAPANGSADKEISDLENAVHQKPDAIVIDPLGRAALAAPIARAMAAGIPVILCANGVEGGNYVTRVDVDLYHTGYSAADGLARSLNGKGNVVMFSGIAGVDAAETWKKAAEDAFSKYPDIKIVAHDYAQWSVATGKSKAAAMIAAHPQIDGVWAGGSEMAVGAILAFKDAGRPMPKFGVDNPLNGFLRLSQENNIQFTGYPDPPAMSKVCLDTAIEVLKGKPVKKFIDVTSILPNSDGYTEKSISTNYVPQLNDDFVPPATAPVSAYVDAGFARKG